MVRSMNFTREPIIETIITAREGSRLIVRSSKSQGQQEDYSVEAVEVVSFGQALFFRSLEKPKAFLVPVSDYEVIEAKESRAGLKHAQFERTIKIGGGREASVRREADAPEEVPVVAEEEVAETASHGDRRRERRRNRRRRPQEEERAAEEPAEAKIVELPKTQENPAAALATLIPPPPTLISETIGRYKEMLPQEKPAPEIKKEEPPVLENRTPPQQEFSAPTDWSHFLS